MGLAFPNGCGRLLRALPVEVINNQTCLEDILNSSASNPSWNALRVALGDGLLPWSFQVGVNLTFFDLSFLTLANCFDPPSFQGPVRHMVLPCASVQAFVTSHKNSLTVILVDPTPSMCCQRGQFSQRRLAKNQHQVVPSLRHGQLGSS